MPKSLKTAVPPVSTAMSPSMALRRSPYPGALTAQTLKMPRILLTTNVAKASPSTSSAMISNGLLALLTASRIGTSFFADGDLLFEDQHQAVVQFDDLVVRVGDEMRREKTAIELHAFDDFDGRLAAATFFDRDHAVFANFQERVGEHATDRGIIVTGDRGNLLNFLLDSYRRWRVDILPIAAVTASTALLIPRASAIGSAPAAIIFRPSRKIASASTVAVVVPSPATSFVLLAASLTSWAPRFS